MPDEWSLRPHRDVFGQAMHGSSMGKLCTTYAERRRRFNPGRPSHRHDDVCDMGERERERGSLGEGDGRERANGTSGPLVD